MLRLSQVELAVDDLDAAVAAYDRVFGREPVMRGIGRQQPYASYGFDGFQFLLRPREAPHAQDAGEHRTEPPASSEGPASAPLSASLAGFAFDCSDLDALRRRFRRLSLQPTDIEPRHRVDAASGRMQRWRSLRLEAPIVAPLAIEFRQVDGEAIESPVCATAPVVGLDLIVIATRTPERLAALFGAYLDLDMVLDKQMPGGARLMQFLAGTSMIEVVHRPASGAASDEAPATAGASGSSAHDDRIWGISWQVDDIDAMRARVQAAGLNASDVKTGAKPGTRVFTLRDGTGGVPTLVMQWTATPP